MFELLWHPLRPATLWRERLAPHCTPEAHLPQLPPRDWFHQLLGAKQRWHPKQH